MASQIDALPDVPSRAAPSTFSARMDAFLSALPTFRTQTNTVATEAETNASTASAAAITATTKASEAGGYATDAQTAADAAAASASATKWVSGTTYAEGDVVWSPVDYHAYRRIVSGAGTTDPSADPTNWTRQLQIKTINGTSLIGTGNIDTPVGVPIGGIVGFGTNITDNQLNFGDEVYLKTGIIDDADLYPSARSAPYATVTTATIGAASAVTSTLASNGSNIVVRTTSGTNQYFLSVDGGWTYTQRSNSVSFGDGITYGNGVFVATVGGTSADVMTSSDGATWTIHAGAMPASVSWYSVVFCNGIFLAVSGGTTNAARSVDGVTWTSVTLPTYVNQARMAYGAGVYVLISSGSTVMCTSPDLTTWTQRYETFSGGKRDVAFANGVFVLTGYDDGNSIRYSTNGVSWSGASTAIPYLDSCILVKDGAFHVWHNGSRYYSTNGSTWSYEEHAVYPKTDPMTNPIIAVSNGFVSLNYGNYLVYSLTGLTWARQQLANHNAASQLVYGDGWWMMPVATGTAGDYTLGWSKDGFNWLQHQTYFAGVSTTPQFRQAAYFGGKWYIYSTGDNKLWSSSNRLDWTEVTKPWTSPTFFNVANNMLFIHRSGSVTSMYYTADGTTWLTTGTFPDAATYRNIVYGNGTYILSGSAANQLYYTTDLSSAWTAATLPASLTIYHVVFDGTRFIASVTDNAISLIESTDGVTWTAVPSKYQSGVTAATQHGFALASGEACFTTTSLYEYTTTSEGRYLRSVSGYGHAAHYGWFATDGSSVVALQTTVARKTTPTATHQVLNDVNYKLYHATANLQPNTYMRVK